MGDRAARERTSARRDDPKTYATFDEFVAGAGGVSSLRTLAERWSEAHPAEPVRSFGDHTVPLAAPNTLAFVECGVTSAW
jgi:hypothetical protein